MASRANGPPLIQTLAEMRAVRRDYQAAQARVAVVPTMGFLHEGHLSLADIARGHADRVVLSIFVNPTQFGPGEDYEQYPRDLDRDLALAEERGVDAVFAPEVDELYPHGESIWVEPGPLAERLCGLRRRGHFRGVLTVVAKLFGCVKPDVAVFGRKDYQQLVLVRRMAEELRMPVRIEAGPIVRDADGLALSSRNGYLGPAERGAARSLSAALRGVRVAFADGTEAVADLTGRARATMEEAGVEVEYVEIVGPDDLEPVTRASGDSVCALAAEVGRTRLIDNATLGGPSSLGAPGS